jgi:MazG family protein
MSDSSHDTDELTPLPADLPAASPAEARAFARLLGLIRRLRGPQGCAWDRQQTLRTMTPYLIEETYEVVDAIERDADPDLREEIGDLIFLLFFCLEMAREEGRFAVEAALDDHIRKMIARHPHVFGDPSGLSAGGAAKQWEEIKQQEKRERRSVLDGRLPSLPALTAAYRVQEKAAAVGFDWQRVQQVLDKVEEEIAELRGVLAATPPADADASLAPPSGQAAAASDHGRRLRAELGDLLFALVNVARFLAIDPEAALRATTARFTRRFRHIEERLAAGGRRPTEATLAEMDALWEEAKALEANDGEPEHPPSS